MLDLDSTIFPLLPAMAMHPGGERVNYADCPTWDGLIDLCAGETFDDRLKTMLGLFDLAWTPETMAKVGAFPGAVQTARALSQHGVQIHVITHRPEKLYAATLQYLLDLGLPFDMLIVHPKVDKVAYCVEHGIGVAVDDHHEFIPRAHQAGITVRSLRFNYNSGALDDAGVPVASDWAELGPQVMDAVEQRVLDALAN